MSCNTYRLTCELQSQYIVKSTKVQTLGAVTCTLHATTDCTDDASIVG